MGGSLSRYHMDLSAIYAIISTIYIYTYILNTTNFSLCNDDIQFYLCVAVYRKKNIEEWNNVVMHVMLEE